MNPTNPFLKQAPIEGVKNIVLIGSGKGGVGKSTISANLAVEMAQNYKVGLLDGDLYGPSVAHLFGVSGEKLEVNEKNFLQPLEKFKVKLMSMAFLSDPNQAVIWRGPMLFKAIDQFLRQVSWGELDYLFVDLPPGTGDIALSFAQKVPCSGAIVVSTPQNLSFLDAKKSISMMETLNIPLIGVVENMSYFQNKEDKVEIFKKGNLKEKLKEKNIPLICEIPLDPYLGFSCESGLPLRLSEPNSPLLDHFKKLKEVIESYPSNP